MAEKKKKILYVGTHAGDDPEKAAMPFVLACAALAMDIEVSVTLSGNGVIPWAALFPSGDCQLSSVLDCVYLAKKAKPSVTCRSNLNVTPM